MTQIFFEVFAPIPTLNKLLRMHWVEKAKTQKAVAEDVSMAVTILDVHGEVPPGFLGAKQKRAVVITLVRKKLQDPDNLVGSVKPLVDAVKKAGLIFDDSPAWLTLKVKQIQGKPEKTFVEVRGT